MYLYLLIPLELPFYIEAPSALLFYTLLVNLFDKVLWKKGFINKLLKTPNLNGKYKGLLKSSRDGFTLEHIVLLEIIQNWTTICVKLSTELSNSISISASVKSEIETETSLMYYFNNIPRSSSPKDMHSHYGFATITFEKRNYQHARCNYFTGKDREYFGTIDFTKVL